MADKSKNRDYPLAETPNPVTILDDIQKASDERLRLKREVSKSKSGANRGQSPTMSIQGLASLKNTFGKKITNKTR